MEPGAGSDDGRRVIPLGKEHERMVSAARQQRAIHERFQPGQDRREERSEKIPDERRHIRQIVDASMQQRWYHSHSSPLSVT